MGQGDSFKRDWRAPELMRPKTLGVIFIIISSLLWAVQPVLVRTSGAATLQIVAIASITAGMVSLAYAVCTKTSLRIEKKSVLPIVYITVAGSLIGDLIWFYSLKHVPALNAMLLGHLQPIFIVLIGAMILKEDHINKWDYWGIGVMILAALFVTTKTLENAASLEFGTSGDALVLVATLFWATTTIVARKYLKDVASSVLVAFRYLLVGVCLLFFILLSSGSFRPDVFQIVLGVSIGIGMILYYEGLKRLKAAQTSALELTTPFFAAIIAFLFLNENVTILQMFGIALLFLGVRFIAKKEH
jgi:drug/metabolite transporter (DMT)-like permease